MTGPIECVHYRTVHSPFPCLFVVPPLPNPPPPFPKYPTPTFSHSKLPFCLPAYVFVIFSSISPQKKTTFALLLFALGRKLIFKSPSLLGHYFLFTLQREAQSKLLSADSIALSCFLDPPLSNFFPCISAPSLPNFPISFKRTFLFFYFWRVWREFQGKIESA